jgi:hypothetical protein
MLAYGPKVFTWLELPNDSALNSRSLVAPMHQTSRTNLKSPDDPEILERARILRMRLQRFRFEHYKNCSVPTIPSGVQLSARPSAFIDHSPFRLIRIRSCASSWVI